MRSEFVMLVLVVGACKETAAPQATPGSGAGPVASADAVLHSASDADVAADVAASGSAFEDVHAKSSDRSASPNGPDGEVAATAKASPPSKVPAEAPEGDISRDEIRRSIQRARGAQMRCYQDELKQDPQLEGKVTVSFTIGVDGKVVDAKGAGMTPTMNACIAKVFSQMRFARPSGGVVKVNYPLTFRPEP